MSFSWPSLSALLSSPGPPVDALAAQAPPLVISSALPPIPGKAVEKARNGAYIEFKEFLVDNLALVQRLKELGNAGMVSPATQTLAAGSRMRDVPDALTWASCFLAYMAARTSDDETKELAAYAMIVIMLSRKHPGAGWLLYDRQFRQQRAAGASLPWNEINASLMAATVLSHAGDKPCQSCPLCFGVDHTKEECALAPLELAKLALPGPSNRPPPTSRAARRPAPYPSANDNICCRFNSGYCGSNPCKFEHTCSNCFKPGHPATPCQEPRGRPRWQPGDQPRLPGP